MEDIFLRPAENQIANMFSLVIRKWQNICFQLHRKMECKFVWPCPSYRHTDPYPPSSYLYPNSTIEHLDVYIYTNNIHPLYFPKISWLVLLLY